ncbi:MAG TPA: MMPL family transporter [Solirubrobacterales bacterium]|nr:MMPL family transporter [Solirubrobacterales bacterium]
MISRLAAAVTGPRGRWLTIAVWLALGLGGYLGHSRIDDVTAAGQSSFLPRDAESTRALDALEHGSGGGEEVPTVIVFERNGGLSKADLNAIGRIGEGLNRLGITGATPIIDPFSAETAAPLGEVARVAKGIGPLSRDGEAALVVLALDAADRGAIGEGVHTIRRFLAENARPGLNTYVTGPGGIAADLERVADEAGRTLLIATLGLVLVLLLVVYRAPLLAALPLLVVGTAYMVSAGLAYLLIEAGWITVNTEGTFLLLVLIFGAGTDYSLLLVHRYREELRGGAPAARALPTALAESVPAIAASGGTVIAAMLVLLVADLQSTHWLGPILALGIATMLAAAFTLLPALLSVLGERAFWQPGRSRGSFRKQDVQKEPRDLWGRVAGLVQRRSRTIVFLVTAALLVLALGNFAHHGTIGFGQGETRPTNSSRGTEVLNEHFPPGIGSPLTAVVAAEELEAVIAAMKDLDVVQLALPVPPTGAGDEGVVVLVLHGDPYSGEAAAEVERIRNRLHAIAPSALLGGIPAENYDIEQTNAHDTRLIVPLVLLVVGLILAAVLRALLAPAYLMLTVVLSFAATLGLCTAIFSLLSDEGVAFNLVLMSFLFLVALGVDYNIFLMTRAREEAAARGTEKGVLAALVHTGGVVTGAGLILAGTFATLTLLPLEELVQIGATVAIGVLLDTFVVRALLIPAITYRLGDRAWWPGRVSPPNPDRPV